MQALVQDVNNSTAFLLQTPFYDQLLFRSFNQTANVQSGPATLGPELLIIVILIGVTFLWLIPFVVLADIDKRKRRPRS